MELSERCIAQLEKEGYENVYERHDTAGATHAEAIYTTPSSLIVTEGSLSVIVDGKKILLNNGERTDIPAHVPYSTAAGPTGCQLVIGE